MKVHELKSWPDQFEAVKDGDKRFEFRKNDRGFQVGDLLHLRKFYPCERCHGTGRDYTHAGHSGGEGERCGCGPLHGEYAKHGDDLFRRVLYVMDKGFGLPDGYVVLSLDDEQNVSSVDA